jgi:hypothetical protein
MQSDIQDNFWRFLYAFPVFINILMIILFAVKIKHEPIIYTLSKADYQPALDLIQKVYHSSEDKNKILENLK